MILKPNAITSTRRRDAISWCLLIVVFLLLQSAGNTGEKAKSRFRALCVGLRYPGTGRELKFTTSDVRAVAEAFATASGYDDLSSDIVCLVDDDPGQTKPTPREVRSRLSGMAKNAGPEDRLVFYFSGHGLRGDDDRSILVCHADKRGDDGNLYLSEIRDILEGSSAKDKLLIVDACHSGGKSAGDNLAPASLAKSLAGGGKAAGRETVAWLVSCDVSEQSWEDDESKQGLFTRFFLEAVGPYSTLADTNFDGMLSLPELNYYISNAIGHYIHGRKMRHDRDWLTRRQSPRMGIGGTVSLSGEELGGVSLFYCVPDSSPSSSTSLQASCADFQTESYYLGTWRSQDMAGEVGFIFDNNSGVAVSGACFDPTDIRRKKSFTGNTSGDAADKLQAVVTTERAGLRRGEWMNKTCEFFLRNANSYQLRFTVSGDGLEAVSSGNFKIQAKRLSRNEYHALNQRNEDRVAQRHQRVIQAVSPNSTYIGTWNNAKNEAGEVAVTFTQIGSEKVTAQGYFFDPQYPQDRKEFSASLLYDDGSRWQIKADVNRAGMNRRDRKSKTQEYLLRNNSSYSVMLQVTDSGLEGESSDGTKVIFRK